MTSPIIGNGTTIAFATSLWTGKVKTITPSGGARESLDVTHLATVAADPNAGERGSKEFIPAGNSDPGELRVEFFLDPDDPPPLDGPKETVTVTFPLPDGMATAPKWVGQGFATSFETAIEVDGVVMGTLVVKLSGKQVVTPAA